MERILCWQRAQRHENCARICHQILLVRDLQKHRCSGSPMWRQGFHTDERAVSLRRHSGHVRAVFHLSCRDTQNKSHVYPASAAAAARKPRRIHHHRHCKSYVHACRYPRILARFGMWSTFYFPQRNCWQSMNLSYLYRKITGTWVDWRIPLSSNWSRYLRDTQVCIFKLHRRSRQRKASTERLYLVGMWYAKWVYWSHKRVSIECKPSKVVSVSFIIAWLTQLDI